MLKRTRTKEQVLSLLSEPESVPALDRGAKEAGLLRWLHGEAKKLKVSTNDPAYKFMAEKLQEARPRLEEVWESGSDEEFVKCLRKEYIAVGLKALKLGVKAEEEVARQKNEVVSAGHLFRMREV